MHPNLLPPFSNPKDQSPVRSAPREQSRSKTAHKSSNYSTNNGSVKILSETLGRSCSDQVLVAQPSEISGHAAQNIQLSHQNDPPPALAQLDSTRGSNKKAVPKAFDNIISHLMTIFPHYTRYLSFKSFLLLWVLMVVVSQIHGENVLGFLARRLLFQQETRWISGKLLSLLGRAEVMLHLWWFRNYARGKSYYGWYLLLVQLPIKTRHSSSGSSEWRIPFI